MVRSVWRGTVSFGLVSIPVRLYPATRREDVKFNMLHRECGGRLRYRKYCPQCDETVSTGDTVRGYEYEKDRYVMVEDEELSLIAGEQNHQIELVSFVHLPDIDPVHYDRTYHVVPERPGFKPYALLTQAMAEADRVGVGRFSLRAKPRLVALRVRGSVLLLETMFHHDEVVSGVEDAGYEPEEIDVHPRERQMAVQLIHNLSEDFRAEEYPNTYREDVLAFIDEKIEGREVHISPPEREDEVADLMEALERSLEDSKRAAGDAR